MDQATAIAIVGVAGFIGTLGSAALAYRVGAATAREETERLREQHREDERRNRQGTYHQVIALVNRILWASDDEIEQLTPQWHFVSAGVTLFGAPSVVERMRPLGEAVSNRPRRHRERWRAEVIEAARDVAHAMREDIGTPPVVRADQGKRDERTGGGAPSTASSTTATVDQPPS